MQDPDKTDSSVRYVTISADQAGQRIDNFLIAIARDVPKSHIYRIVRTGQVRANGGRVKPTYRLCEGDYIRIPPIVQRAKLSVLVPQKLISELESSVIFEDDELIVINKPPGVAVHAGSGLHFGVIEAFRQSRKSASSRLELVHRLDRGTSGCLVIAKGRQSALRFQQLFRERSVEKHYNALLCGQWPQGTTTLTNPLRKNVEQGGARRVVVDGNGKPAITHVTLLQDLGRESEVQIEIKTGRTHQIRVHTAHFGYPIIGDSRYGHSDVVARHRKLGLKRLFLHCMQLKFSHYEFNAAVDANWQSSRVRLQVK